jgi:hypothetical protein
MSEPRALQKGVLGGGLLKQKRGEEITEEVWVSFRKSVTCPHCTALVMGEGLNIAHWWNAIDNRKLKL